MTPLDAGGRDAMAAPGGPPTPEAGWPVRTARSLRARLDLPNALRLAGAALLALSLSRFLLAGVAVENDLERFALLLLQSAIFTGTGVAVARWLDDLRGARLLFGVALASVPAGFTVLGAMIHSLVPLELLGDPGSGLARVATRDLPGFARWELASFGDVGIAALATALVLVPTTFFGFATLARRSAARLGATLLAGSALLLVPVREPELAGVLVLACSALALRTWRSLAGTDDALATLEGRFAQALLAVPAGIVAVRASVADDPGVVFATMLATVVALGARTAIRASGPASRSHVLLLPLAGLATVGAMPGLHEILSGAFGSGAAFAIAAALTGALTVELVRHSRADRTARAVEALWAVPVLAVATLAGLGDPDELAVSLACIGAVLAVALCRRRRSLGVPALLAALVPFAGALASLGDWFADHRWEGLAALGVIVIVGAGVLQRRGRARGAGPAPGAAGARRVEAIPSPALGA